MTDLELSGRRALVTGSSYGLGAAIAARLAAAGAHVVVTGRDTQRAQAVADAIRGRGGGADCVAADLADPAAPAQLVAAACQDGAAPLDVLVNNAAMLIMPSPSAEVAAETIDRAFAVNVRAPFLLTGLVAPAMAQRGGGAIVNVGSINGQKGFAQSALYSATKATIHSLTQSFAAEYASAGVRVNAVAPGPTLTEKVQAMESYLAPMIERFPSRRASTLEEIAEAVLFLAGPRSTNIHGAILAADGGAAAA